VRGKATRPRLPADELSPASAMHVTPRATKHKKKNTKQRRGFVYDNPLSAPLRRERRVALLDDVKVPFGDRVLSCIATTDIVPAHHFSQRPPASVSQNYPRRRSSIVCELKFLWNLAANHRGPSSTQPTCRSVARTAWCALASSSKQTEVEIPWYVTYNGRTRAAMRDEYTTIPNRQHGSNAAT